MSLSHLIYPRFDARRRRFWILDTVEQIRALSYFMSRSFSPVSFREKLSSTFRGFDAHPHLLETAAASA